MAPHTCLVVRLLVAARETWEDLRSTTVDEVEQFDCYHHLMRLTGPVGCKKPQLSAKANLEIFSKSTVRRFNHANIPASCGQALRVNERIDVSEDFKAAIRQS